MDKTIFYSITFVLLFPLQIYSQTEEFNAKEKIKGDYKGLSFSGFRVELIPASEFSIVLNNDSLLLKKQSVKNDTLSLMIVDQTGQVPKETIQVYINETINSIHIHNGKLVMEDFLTTDSLNVDFGVAKGTLKIHADKLSLTAGGGIDCEIEGTANYFYGHQGGMSNIRHDNLECDHKEIKITRYF